MLIAEYENGSSSYNVILDTMRIPRLGKGVDANRNILADSFNKAVTVLNEYKEIAEENSVKNIIATGTSFIRDSKNRDDFILYVKNNTGIEIKILSGEDEAKWTFWGGISDSIFSETNHKYMCIIDIGGGSTEISYGKPSGYINRDILLKTPLIPCSLDIGSVRLGEKYLLSHPIDRNEEDEAMRFINQNLADMKLPGENMILIGVAGTVTTLACLKLGLNNYNPKIVEGVEMTLDEVEQIYKTLSLRTIDEMSGSGDYMAGRADIIVSGTLILKLFMEYFNINKITTSTRGLRYGILLRELFK